MEQDKVLTRDDILNSDGPVKELVRLPELGGSVWVQGMTVEDRDIWEDYIHSLQEADSLDPRRGEQRALLVVLCCINEEGEKLFTLRDAQALKKKSFKAFDKICRVALRLSALYEGATDEAAKKSQTGQE